MEAKAEVKSDEIEGKKVRRIKDTMLQSMQDVTMFAFCGCMCKLNLLRLPF